MRWRRCCATGTCSMKQSHNTNYNSWGFDLISLAAVLWHHTAALRRRAAALRCRTAALRQPNKWHMRCCRGSETVTLSCRTSFVIAVQLCVRLGTLDTKGGHYVQTYQNNPQSWCFTSELYLFCNEHNRKGWLWVSLWMTYLVFAIIYEILFHCYYYWWYVVCMIIIVWLFKSNSMNVFTKKKKNKERVL